MAQRRLISRSLGSSRKFHALHNEAGRLGDFAQALFPLLVVNADDHGRLPADAFTVRLQAFPISSHTDQDFETALRAMHKVELIRLYSANGNRYLEIMNFRREQPGIKYIARSRYPEPPAAVPQTQQVAGIRQDSPDLPLEVKRSEEKRSEEKQSYSSEPCGSSPSASPTNSKPLIHIPLNTGEEFPVTESMVGEFRSLYPAVDVEQELRSMRGWCIANPMKRKTRRGVTKFINSWLARAQDKSSSASRQKSVFDQFREKSAEV